MSSNNTTSGHLERLPQPESILVFRALKLGDMLCSLPALRALRRRWPAARIDLLMLPASRELMSRYSNLVDSIIDFPGFPGFPELEPDVPAFLELVTRLRGRRYDFALQIHGDGPISNTIIGLLGASSCAGLASPGAWRPNDGYFVDPPTRGHEIHRCLAVTAALGCDAHDTSLEFPITADDIARTHAPGFPGNGVRYVCVHPGSSTPVRRWPVAAFAEVANYLAAAGYCIVLTGTPAEENLAHSVEARLRLPALNVAGRTSLGAMAALLRASSLLISNDTGVSHLAAAVGARAIVISSDVEPWRWAPLDRSHITMVVSRPEAPIAAHTVIGAADAILSSAALAGVTP